MERQYIGARYVPKIFENPNTGDATWLSGMVYEPLTIVTLAGNSYTSKKPVPSGIGSPLNNPEYWVCTGVFNEQILAIQNQLNSLFPITGENVQDYSIPPYKISNKKCVFITDSYGTYYNAYNKNFIQLACEHAGIPTTNYYALVKGSAGFCMSDDLSFRRVLSDNSSNIPNKETITDIFVFGGANDQTASSEALITSGIESFCEYAKSAYPNAKLHIGFITRSFQGTHYVRRPVVLSAYTKCGEFGAEYLTGSEQIMQYNKLFRTDFVHPTAPAVDHLAKYVANLILSNMCQVTFPNESAGVLSIYESNTVSASNLVDYTSLTYTDGVQEIIGRGGFNCVLDCSLAVTAGTQQLIQVIKFDKMFNPPAVHNITRNAIYKLEGTGNTQIIPGQLLINENIQTDGSYLTYFLFTPTADMTVNKISVSF